MKQMKQMNAAAFESRKEIKRSERHEERQKQIPLSPPFLKGETAEGALRNRRQLFFVVNGCDS